MAILWVHVKYRVLGNYYLQRGGSEKGEGYVLVFNTSEYH